MSRVSVGVPVFNGAGQLRRALDSLCAQTYQNLEIIISDNASTDSTKEICADFASRDRRIRYIRQLTNLGAAANFRKVYQEAKGEFFFWAPHDDVWDARFVEEGVSALERCLQAVASFGTVTFRGTDGRVLLVQQPPSFLMENTPYRRLRAYFRGTVNAVIIYSLFRRAALQDFVWTASMGFENKVALHLIARGGILPVPDMKQGNYVSSKSRTDTLAVFNLQGQGWDAARCDVFFDSLSEIRSCVAWPKVVMLLPAFVGKDKWHRFFVRQVLERLGLADRK